MVHLHGSVACTCAERAYHAQVAGRFDRTAPLGLPAALPDVRGWNCTHRFSVRAGARQLRRRAANRITRRAKTPARSHLVRNLLENCAGESTVIRDVGGAGVLAAAGIGVVVIGNHPGCASPLPSCRTACGTPASRACCRLQARCPRLRTTASPYLQPKVMRRTASWPPLQ